MILNIVILLIIVIIIFNSIIYSQLYKCPTDPLKIKYVRASRLSETISSDSIGIENINVKFDREVPCGIYHLKTIYGDGIAYVGKGSNRTGYLHVKNMDLLKNVSLLDLWDLVRVISNDNHFIRTYNQGCC